MRFDSSSNTPPPLAPSWRMILWAVTLAPALLILGWSLRQARIPQPDPALQGRTVEDARRLKRILKEPRDDVSRLPDDAVRVIAGVDESQPTTKEPSAPTGDDARLDKAILSATKDNTFGITSAEKPAFDAIVAKVRHTDLEDLQRIAHNDVPFAALMLDADHYRGEVLTMEGDLRRIHRLPAGTDDSTTAESFEAWLFTTDSGVNPYRVILSSLPEGIPLGDDLKPPVHARITGYFFKRYSYATAHDFHTAPLVIAKMQTPLTSSTSRAVPPARNSRSLTFLAIGILAALVIVAAVVEVSLLRRSHSRRVSEDATELPTDMSWLDQDPR